MNNSMLLFVFTFPSPQKHVLFLLKDKEFKIMTKPRAMASPRWNAK